MRSNALRPLKNAQVFSSRISRTLSAGFTLIETLVAVSVLAICLTVIFELFSGGLKSSGLSGEYTRGVFYAREKMEEILLLNKLENGIFQGDFEDPFRWKAEVVRLERTEKEEDAGLPFDAFAVKVDVAWDIGGRERHFEISTIKIVERLEIGS